MSGLCWKCGKRFRPSAGAIVSVSRFIGGNRIELHKACAERFDQEHKPNPAYATPTREIMVDDSQAVSGYYRGLRVIGEDDPDPLRMPLNFHDERERT